MKFYYENNLGDNGIFFEKNLIKAIYTAWNIDATLYLVDQNIKPLRRDELHKHSALIFSPLDDNELNSEILAEFGYYMVDGEEEREIREIKTNKVIKYDWDEVKQLI